MANANITLRVRGAEKERKKEKVSVYGGSMLAFKNKF
jgi:hypothetical protein